MGLFITSGLQEATRSLFANKIRSALTLLGIMIGVSSVIIMITVGEGAQRLIEGEIEALGSNLVYVITGSESGGTIASTTSEDLKNSDVNALGQTSSVPSVRRLAAFTTLDRAQIKEGKNEEVTIDVQGVDPLYFEITNLEFAEGEAYTESANKGAQRVAVIGNKAKEGIFGENAQSVIGERLRIKGQNYTIVGVLEESSSALGSILGGDNSENIFIPTRTAQRSLLGTNDHVWGVLAEAKNKDSIDQAEKEITTLLRKRHKIRGDEENDFQIQTQEQFLEIFSTVLGVFTLFLSALAAISLIVGGVGIMNIMLVTVSERTKEIGLRKAIGASRTAILIQFLIEALLITGAGGVVGIVFGLLVSYGVSLIAGFSFMVNIGVVAMAFGVSAAFGLIFGMYPANKASKLDPIIALRS